MRSWLQSVAGKYVVIFFFKDNFEECLNTFVVSAWSLEPGHFEGAVLVV